MASVDDSYGLDHTAVGQSLLRAWKIDASITEAVARHHERLTPGRMHQLWAIIQLADYLYSIAELGFCARPEEVDAEILAALGWNDHDVLKAMTEEVLAAFGCEYVFLFGN